MSRSHERLGQDHPELTLANAERPMAIGALACGISASLPESAGGDTAAAEFEQLEAAQLSAGVTRMIRTEGLDELTRSRQVGPNGWLVDYSSIGSLHAESEDRPPVVRLHKNPGQGPFGEFSEQLEVMVGEEPGTYLVTLGTLPLDGGFRASYNGGKYDRVAIKPGHEVTAVLCGDKIVGGIHKRGRAYKAANADSSTQIVGDCGVEVLPFTEADATALTAAITGIMTDITELAANRQTVDA